MAGGQSIAAAASEGPGGGRVCESSESEVRDPLATALATPNTLVQISILPWSILCVLSTSSNSVGDWEEQRRFLLLIAVDSAAVSGTITQNIGHAHQKNNLGEQHTCTRLASH